jgi:ribosome-associated toxin RatA of RatAB toxin-antitoxin module
MQLTAHAPAVDPRAAFARIAAFETYPAHSDAVRAVEILERTDESVVSSWEVNFRRGILCWTERATLHPDDGKIIFEEVDGDVDEFSGYWEIVDGSPGSHVCFFVSFDVGIPTLEQILDPIAEDALHANIASIVRGLLGEDTVVTRVPSHPGPCSS